MTTVETLIDKHKASELEVKDEIAKLNKKLQWQKALLTSNLATALSENPEESLNVEALSAYLDREQVLQLVSKVAETRPLRETELTSDLYFKVECQGYQNKKSKIGSAIFKSLNTDQERLRLALFCGGTSAIYNMVPEALDFLNEHFDICADYKDTPNFLRWEGYNHDLGVAGLRLGATHGCCDDLESFAHSVQKLLTMGYPGRFIDVLESTLKANGAYGIILKDREDKPGVVDVTLELCRYGHESNVYTGKGDTNDARLLDVFRYVADHHPHHNPEENEEG